MSSANLTAVDCFSAPFLFKNARRSPCNIKSDLKRRSLKISCERNFYYIKIRHIDSTAINWSLFLKNVMRFTDKFSSKTDILKISISKLTITRSCKEAGKPDSKKVKMKTHQKPKEGKRNDHIYSE